MATHQPTPSDDDEGIVEAVPESNAQEINDLSTDSAHRFGFAMREAKFAQHVFRYAEDMHKRGRMADADRFTHDAEDLMDDAEENLEQAEEEEERAQRLRQQQQHQLSMALQAMHDTQLMTLRDAVQSVRRAVEDLTPTEVQRMRRIARSSEEPVADSQIEVWRETVVTTAIRIEVSLENPDTARHSAVHLVRDLSLFAAAAVELAKLAPQLMDVLRQFGQMILQFHFG